MIKIYTPQDRIESNIILPTQVHGTRIIEIINGKEDLSACDGLWTQDSQFAIGVKTADCAPIVFATPNMVGVVHAGWRGLVGGICEKMLEISNSLKISRSSSITEKPSTSLQIFCGPCLHQFEIQKDDCYEQIFAKFGDSFFFEEEGKIIFDFKSALKSVLPTCEFDPRNTFDDVSLASWRRDHDQKRNITVVKKV
jgi:copper oxidase (laccase) domain-containing protein